MKRFWLIAAVLAALVALTAGCAVAQAQHAASGVTVADATAAYHRLSAVVIDALVSARTWDLHSVSPLFALLAVPLGGVLPGVIATVQQAHWSKGARWIVGALVCVAAGFTQAVSANDLDGLHTLAAIVVIFQSAMTAYQTYWRPSGKSDTIEAVTTEALNNALAALKARFTAPDAPTLTLPQIGSLTATEAEEVLRQYLNAQAAVKSGASAGATPAGATPASPQPFAIGGVVPASKPVLVGLGGDSPEVFVPTPKPPVVIPAPAAPIPAAPAAVPATPLSVPTADTNATPAGKVG